MITDECKHVGIAHNFKVKITLVSGNKKITASGLNYNSSVYIDLINWHQTYIRLQLFLMLYNKGFH